MNSLVATINALGGIATRVQLLDRGFSGFALTGAVRSRQIRRIRRGWYATPSASADAADAVRVGGRLSHTSAARHYGLWAGLDTRLHLTVTRGAAKLRPLARAHVVHWIARGRQDRRSTRVWVVGLDECLRGVLREADAETAIACVDTARTIYKLSTHRIESIVRNEPVRSRVRAAQTRAGSDSGPESLARQRLERGGIAVVQQFSFPGISPVDILIGGWLAVEIDGFAYHSDAASFERDRRKAAQLVAVGCVVLRFSYNQVMFEWPFVEASIRAALAVRN